MWCLLFTLAKTVWCLLSYVQARQLQGECQEQNVDLYITSVVLNNGFNIVSCDCLWKIMTKFGCHLRFIAMVQKFNDGMKAHVQKDGEYSVTKGVKQDCAMALINIVQHDVFFRSHRCFSDCEAAWFHNLVPL